MAENRGPQAQASLYALNKILRIPQERIASAIGVSFSTANAWLNGRRAPQPRQLRQLRDFARESLGRSADLPHIPRVIAKLCIEYKGSLPLTSDPLEVLLREVLSLKTATIEAGAVYDFLTQHHRSWSRLAERDYRELESDIHAAGFGSVKTQSILKILRQLKKDFGKPALGALKKWDNERAVSYLRTLPGVDLRIARKTLMMGLRRNTFPVDGSVYRVALRAGLIDTCKTSADAHTAFDLLIEKLDVPAHTLYAALQEVASNYCVNTAPTCRPCPVSSSCPSAATPRERQQVPTTVRPEAGQLVAIDLYSGCGGLSLGLVQAEYDVRYALDWDANACKTHSHNLPHCTIQREDIRAVSSDEILRKAGGRVDLVAGGPNCQGVSQRGLRSPDDPRNFMFPEFLRVVHDLRPRAFLMENVPGLAHRHNFGLLRNIFAEFEKLGYNCGADVLLAANFGVPQLRYRFFLVGILDGERPITFPIPTHVDSSDSTLFQRPFVTVWDALSDLPYVSSEQQKEVMLPYGERQPATDYQCEMRRRSDVVRNHVVSATARINLERALYIPEGGNWKDIPPDLLPERFLTCRMTDHSTTYARLRREFPAFTITALFGNITAGAFLHPIINRALTIREGARLQSFPDDFIFCGPRNSQYRQIGNAVPPLLARAVAGHIRREINNEHPEGVPARITPSVLASERSWDALPVLTPRFKHLFGAGTRWPKGWGPEPDDYADRLDDNYTLRPEFRLNAATEAEHRALIPA